MAAAAALVSAVGTGPRLHVIGFANYLLVWGSAHQWGFAWQDGTLTRRRWHPYAMFVVGAALLTCLVAPGLFNLNMVGSGNTNPPSIAFLAFALAQCGLVLAFEPAGKRILQRPAVWRGVRRLNASVMIVYLWHFVPVIVVAVAFYPTGLLPQPAVGSAEWWALRLVWFALLTVVLIALVMLLMWAQRPLLRIPAAIGRPGPWSPVILLAGLAATMFGLARLAIGAWRQAAAWRSWPSPPSQRACSAPSAPAVRPGRANRPARMTRPTRLPVLPSRWPPGVSLLGEPVGEHPASPHSHGTGAYLEDGKTSKAGGPAEVPEYSPFPKLYDGLAKPVRGDLPGTGQNCQFQRMEVTSRADQAHFLTRVKEALQPDR